MARMRADRLDFTGGGCSQLAGQIFEEVKVEHGFSAFGFHEGSFYPFFFS
jgi:hypothetical protein